MQRVSVRVHLPQCTIWGAVAHPVRRHRQAGCTGRVLRPTLARAAEHVEFFGSEEDFLYEPDTALRLYLDCADVQQWEKWRDTGMFYGYTTNPTILKRDGVKCTLSALKHLAKEAFLNGAEELQLQAWGRSASELVAVGMSLADIDERVVVKLPITLEGVKAASTLCDKEVPFTLTGIYAPHQVVTAIALGASYAAPYLGRMNDAGKQGFESIVKMQDIISLDELEEGSIRLLVASIRSPEEIARLAAEGCNTFTISPTVAEMMFAEPLTNEAAEVFQKDAEAMGASLQ